ncbi:MAG: maleylpyruvate isomerase N-terminal domain-containing protein [Omnitrophica WOR_2 bacterium]
MAKAELLLQLSAGHDRLRRWLDHLSPDQVEARGLVGDWSVKDILSHLTGHEQRLVILLNQVRQSGLSGPIHLQESEDLNAEDIRKFQDQSYAAVSAGWEASFQQVVQAVKTLPENRIQLDQTQPDALINTIRTYTVDHYEEHLGQILSLILKERYTLQSVTDADWQAILEIADASAPRKKLENPAWLAQRKSFPADRYPRQQYQVIDSTGHPVAYGAVEGSENDWYRLFLVMKPELFDAGPADLLYDRLTMDLREAGAAGIWARESALDSALLAWLNERGFSEYRRYSNENGVEFIALRRPLPNTCFIS